MDILKVLDDRIQELELTRNEFLQLKEINAANQMWARIEELKSFKSKLNNGRWVMKVYELMCKANGKTPNETFKNLLIEGAYIDRVYISDILDFEKYKDLHKTVEDFLENDFEYDGDELAAWKRFIDYEVVE